MTENPNLLVDAEGRPLSRAEIIGVMKQLGTILKSPYENPQSTIEQEIVAHNEALAHAHVFLEAIDNDPTIAKSVEKERTLFSKTIDEAQALAKSKEGKHASNVATNAINNAGSEAGGFLAGIGEWFKGLFGGDKDKTAATTTTEDIDPATGLPKKKDSPSLNVGSMIGGLLGAGGGWFLGNLFGGGLLGKIVGALLAIGGVFMGTKAFGGTINHWLGRDSTDMPANPATSATLQNAKVDNRLADAPQLTHEEALAIYQAAAKNAPLQIASTSGPALNPSMPQARTGVQSSASLNR